MQTRRLNRRLRAAYVLTQGYGTFKLRRTLDLRKAWPLAAFVGDFVSGFSGFAMGLVVLAYGCTSSK